jgi:hypothetical protein
MMPPEPASSAPAEQEPIPVAEQKAAGVPPEETVTIADQKAGTPPPELPADGAGSASESGDDDEGTDDDVPGREVQDQEVMRPVPGNQFRTGESEPVRINEDGSDADPDPEMTLRGAQNETLVPPADQGIRDRR